MGKRDKLLSKWENDPPKFAPKEQVLGVLDYHFKNQYEYKGSHIVIKHPKLKDYPEDYGPDGHFVVSVRGGQQVKGVYLKKLATTISFLKDLGELG
ncbi:hypothetical protein [Desulfonatronovibrio hydrogenovorans]|uniref:hypothetical protein n=1 Tax=Desulfonatronovibrio hydrogenovorans TaxID=53245 RepID=UPI000491CE62|nr:hypothetical protein [Desulfonatronovibrio hydrogenovorans]